MTPRDKDLAAESWSGPGMREFVALMAALMAANALAIDAMLPALPDIGHALDVTEDNRRQLVISAFLLGFGGAQLFYGPLSDRIGRKTILIVSLGFYAAFALLAGLASSFELLLGARILQGIAAAGTRVLVVSIVRDRFRGSGMARVMSLVSIVFMIVPMLAPAFGQAVLAVASWRFIFIGLTVYSLAVLIWALLRLPETLPPERRRSLSLAKIREAVSTTLTTRLSIGNTVALTLVMGGLFAYINSIQQIIADVFHRPDLIGIVFAAIAAPMTLSSYVNSRLVMRIGSRHLLLLALTSFTTVAALHFTVAAWMGSTVWSFVFLQAATMACFGLVGANAGALAMEPLGHIAGTASSLQGLITTVGGALIGLVIGQQFDGTILPFLIGLVLCGAAALSVALWANRPGEAEAVPHQT